MQKIIIRLFSALTKEIKISLIGGVLAAGAIQRLAMIGIIGLIGFSNYSYGAGADVNIKDNSGATPLHFNVINGHSDPGDRCARSQYRDLSKRYGEISSFKFDISSLEDYRMGVRQNFDLRCPRMYLSMSRYAKSKKTYKGALAISFEDGHSIKVQKYTSGWTENENKYNKWLGSSWKPDKNDKVNRSFYAIFENNDNAIILRLKDIKVVDVRDGETAYWGAGELYYKMFRAYSGDTEDVCYSKGAYVSHAPRRPPKRARCWLLGIGPFSCRPNGVLPLKADVTNIDITKSLKCYNRLGEFYGLDIERAFKGLDIERAFKGLDKL